MILKSLATHLLAGILEQATDWSFGSRLARFPVESGSVPDPQTASEMRPSFHAIGMVRLAQKIFGVLRRGRSDAMTHLAAHLTPDRTGQPACSVFSSPVALTVAEPFGSKL